MFADATFSENPDEAAEVDRSAARSSKGGASGGTVMNGWLRRHAHSPRPSSLYTVKRKKAGSVVSPGKRGANYHGAGILAADAKVVEVSPGSRDDRITRPRVKRLVIFN